MLQVMEAGDLCLNENLSNTNHTEPLHIRLLRKKYKCVLIWLFSIMSTSQLFYIVIDKFDNKFLEDVMQKMLYMTKKFDKL